MNLERGFRRLFVVLSVVVLGAGIILDSGKLWSHAKIYATLTDGSTEVFDTWSLVGSPPYDRDPATWEMVIKLRKPIDLDALGALDAGLPPGYILDPVEGAIAIPRLKTFRVVRGPAAWSWGDVEFTLIASGVATMLWVGFFAGRWVARGFTS